MRTALVAISVAGCVGAPAFAGTLRVDWQHQFTSAHTVRVWADVSVVDAPAQFVGIAGSLFSVLGTDSGVTRVISFDENAGLGRLLRTPGASPGTLVGDDIMGIDSFQGPQAFTPGFVSSASVGQFFAFEYTFTDQTARTIEFTSQHQYFHVYAGPMAAMGQNEQVQVDVHAAVIDYSGGIAVIPLPPAGAMGVAGLAVLSARRRLQR